MYEVGRLAIKTAGKDAGKTIVIVEKVNDGFVIIDGPIKRKRCNVKHLEPLGEVVKLAKGASTEDVKKVLSGKVKILEKKSRKAGPRPKKQRKEKIKVPELTKEKKLQIPKPLKKEEKKKVKKEKKK